MVEMGDSAEKKEKKGRKTEKQAEKGALPGFFKGVKAEFRKVIWPDRRATLRQSVAVVAISVVMGVIIAILDYIAKAGVNFITSI